MDPGSMPSPPKSETSVLMIRAWVVARNAAGKEVVLLGGSDDSGKASAMLMPVPQIRERVVQGEVGRWESRVESVSFVRKVRLRGID